MRGVGVEFIKKRWPWTGLPLVLLDVLAWFLKQEWSLLTKHLVSFHQDLLREVSMPWWIVLLVIVLPITLIAIYDKWKETCKSKPAEIVLDKTQSRIIKHWQENIPRGHEAVPQDIDVALGIGLSECRKQLIILHEFGVLEENELNEEFQEYGYSMLPVGYKA